MKIFRYKKLSSTQDRAKSLKRIAEDTAIIAETQSKGKGTKGRSFSSLKGGVYLSYIKLYPCKAKEAFTIMMSSALAVVRTLKAFGVEAKIKWPNDIYVSGKKICGILIENELIGEDIKKSVIGIGINVNSEIPTELRSIAISMKEVLNEESDINSVTATLLYNLTLDYTIEEYKNCNLILGKTVEVIKESGSYFAVAKDITESGELILESGEVLSSAEISIKLGQSH